jgi:hypothetical protein
VPVLRILRIVARVSNEKVCRHGRARLRSMAALLEGGRGRGGQGECFWRARFPFDSIQGATSGVIKIEKRVQIRRLDKLGRVDDTKSGR